MKKKAVTLDTIAHTLDNMQSNFKCIDLTLNSMQSNFKRIDSTLETIQKDLSDTQGSVQFLVENAVMRSELRPIIREEIDARLVPMESRLLAAIDGMMGKNQTMEGEVLAHTYRIDRLEQFVGLPKTA